MAYPFNATWTTKTGKQIRIKDMTTGHLKNTLRLLERVTENYENQIELMANPFSEGIEVKE